MFNCFCKVCFLLNHLLFFQVCRHFSLGTQTLKHSSSKHQYQKYSWEVQFNNSDLLVQHVADSWQHWPATQSIHAFYKNTPCLQLSRARKLAITKPFSLLYQIINIFPSVVKLDILTWESKSTASKKNWHQHSTTALLGPKLKLLFSVALGGGTTKITLMICSCSLQIPPIMTFFPRKVSQLLLHKAK